MGYSNGSNTMPVNPSKEMRAGYALTQLKSHPNYKDQEPFKGESLIAYTLRCAAHLVSPPQEPNESYDVECTDIASGILALEEEICERWLKFKNK